MDGNKQKGTETDGKIQKGQKCTERTKRDRNGQNQNEAD